MRDAIARISLTGRIDKPMITVHGTHDSLLPITLDSDVYAEMVNAAGMGGQHRYYRIENGNHTDGLYALFSDKIRPLLPCERTAFTALQTWVDRGTPPPPNRTVPKPTSGDLVNTCSLG
nr:D-(-)-3-hydroxybutyrate oligomer hydrolase [Enemella dayhoffiae]